MPPPRLALGFARALLIGVALGEPPPPERGNGGARDGEEATAQFADPVRSTRVTALSVCMQGSLPPSPTPAVRTLPALELSGFDPERVWLTGRLVSTSDSKRTPSVDPPPHSRCRLCGVRTTLVKSHVYPRALALDLGSDGDRARVISAVPGVPSRLVPSGWYGYFLCSACEDQSQIPDDYAVKFVRQPLANGSQTTTSDGSPAVCWPKADAGMLTLFALWCLWRGAMCGQAEFAHVQLGPHADAIGGLLRRNDPGSDGQYPVVFEAYDTEPDMLWLPWNRIRHKDGVTYWKCFIHRYLIRVKVDSRPAFARFSEVALRSGHPPITPRSDFLGSKLSDTVRRILDERRYNGKGTSPR